MSVTRLLILSLILTASYHCEAQLDSTIEALQKIPNKYISTIENKIDKYSSRITKKTEKTLTKLSRWENKIKTLLEQVSPETAQKLFGNNQTTFSTLLKKYQEGKVIAEGYKAQYNQYRDKLTTSIKYLEVQKDKLNKNLIEPINTTKEKLNDLEEDVSNAEVVEKFIKERKKLLINEAVKYIGKSKYLTKIDKEAYYYVETLRNYKELFSDKKKAEELAIKILNKIPAFQKFYRENGRLASLFGGSSNTETVQNLGGMQTRVSVQALMKSKIASGGPNAAQYVSQNMQQGRNEFTNLKNKIAKAGGGNSDTEIPNFIPNKQKSKTFKQRLEYGSNFQFSKINSLTAPMVADLALSVGYKLNDKSIIGIGGSYKMGLGSIQHIDITHQGIGIRSFIDWKLKKQFFVTGGFEMNYNAQFKNIEQVKYYDDWQRAGLIGLTKKLNIKTKWFKGSNVQLLYDMLYRQHTPVSQPVLLRIGYSFK